MTGLELIAAALAAGAGAGVKDTASAAVKDAYTGFKALLARRLTPHGTTAEVLQAEVVEPGVWQARLGQDLTASGAADDPDVLAAARRLLELIDPAATWAGKYQVDASHARGVQVGDANIQTNTFT